MQDDYYKGYFAGVAACVTVLEICAEESSGQVKDMLITVANAMKETVQEMQDEIPKV